MSKTNCRICMILGMRPNKVINGSFADGLTNWTSTTHSQGCGGPIPDFTLGTDPLTGRPYGDLYPDGIATYTQPVGYDITLPASVVWGAWGIAVAIVSAVNTIVTMHINYSGGAVDTFTIIIVGGRQLYSHGSTTWLDLTPYVNSHLNHKLISITFTCPDEIWIDDLQLASYP